MHPLRPDDPTDLGGFRLRGRIGAGGMGVVYFGHTVSGRPAAVKVMHREFANRPRYRQRFRREATVARALTSGHTVAVIDADPDGPIPWLATEYVPSISLRDAVRRFGPLPPDSARRLANGLTEALRDIHRSGGVHLDVKPTNVLLCADGLRLIDFGIAHWAGDTDEPGGPSGSPGYMSPEQWQGGAPSAASDVYSLGATLAFACTAAHPTLESAEAVPDAGLRTLIRQCLSPAPADRPVTPEPPEHDDSAPWPPGIDAVIAERVDPQWPVSAPANRRRLVWAGLATAILTLAAIGTGAAASTADVDAVIVEQTAAGSIPAPATESAAEPRTLEFSITGDTTLSSVTYTVNDQDTTVEDVRLPWEQQIEIPALPEQTTWSLVYRYPHGDFQYQVLLDGFRVQNGMSGSSGEPSENTVTGLN